MRSLIYAVSLVAVAPAAWAQSVQSLTLMNAETHQPIAGFNPIPSGVTLNLATLPTRKLNVRINTAPALVGSVRVLYGGSSRTENTAPYAMAGDTNGAYWEWTPAVGSLTITATAYSGANASGTASTPYAVTLNVTNVQPTTSYTLSVTNGSGSGRYTTGTVVNVTANAAPLGKVFDRWVGDVAVLSSATAASTAFAMPAANVALTATYKDQAPQSSTAVTGLVLINADTDQPISGFNPILNGSTLNLATLQTRRLNVRALTNPPTIGSVKFVYTGGSRVESTAPFAMAGDTNGDYWNWTPKVGSLTITATPYSASGAAGAAGTPATVTLTVIDSGSTVVNYTATVTNGSGSGTYPAGTKVTITANAAPVGKVFDRWAGSTAYLANALNASTTLTMPASHVSLAATYKDATSTPPPTQPSDIPQEVNGFLEVEAESFVSQEKTENRRWYVTSTTQTPNITPDGDPNHASTASGAAYLEILPDTRRTHSDTLINNVNYSNVPGQVAVLKYTVRINNPGRYYVWVRAFSTGSEDNGIHVGLNGTWPASGARMQWCNGKNMWYWESAQRTAANHCGVPGLIYLDIPSAGTHTITFSMREDGFEFDKFILTKQANMPRPTK